MPLVRDLAGNAAGGLSNRAVANATAGVLLSATSLTLAEGGSGRYTVRLAARPSEDVTVTITSDNAEVTVDDTSTAAGTQNALTFTTMNWATAQRVTVRAAEDADAANDNAILTHAISGAAEYASLADPTLPVKVNDNDGTNAAPAFATDTAARSFPENTAAGTDIGDALTATDADSGDTLTYTLGGTDTASFDIVSTSGQLRTKSGGTYDFETKSRYTVTVEVSDGTATDTVTVTITLADANEPPAFTTDTAAFTVAENTTAVGTLTTTDPDAADTTVTYALGGTDEALFSISSTGAITFDTAPDFETPGCGTNSNTCTFTVTASAGAAGRAMSTPARTVVTVTVVAPPAKPAAPTFGTATASSVVVNWLAPANPGAAITDYDVQYRAVGVAGDVARAFDRLGESVAEVKPDNLAGAAAARWFALSPEERANAGLMAPTHGLRQDINAIVRERPVRDGTVHGPSMTVERLVSRGYTNAEKTLAANYKPGDTVAFYRPNKRLGVEKGDELRVAGVDRKTRTVKLAGADGRTAAWEPNRIAARAGGVEVYRSEEIELRAGDSIRWTRNDAGLGLVNSGTAEVAAVHDGRVAFRLEDGRSLDLAPGDPQLRHRDRAWASTVHAFQGRTVDTVIAAMEANHPHLTTQKSFYVEISRARDRAELVADDRVALKEQLEAATGERIAALEAVEPDRAKGREAGLDRDRSAGREDGALPSQERETSLGREIEQVRVPKGVDRDLGL